MMEGAGPDRSGRGQRMGVLGAGGAQGEGLRRKRA